MKAVLDFVSALLLTILFAPLLLVIALLIRLDSRGPAIYRQERVGLFGNLFTIYKFRTMRLDAPCISTEEMQLRDINLTTRFGTLLRKASLDELPQLFNILKGEMSFIGPRPALPSQSFVNARRLELNADTVRPGITGLAQVMGRDNLDDETKVQYDAAYCEQMSLSYDIHLIIRTIISILTAHGNK